MKPDHKPVYTIVKTEEYIEKSQVIRAQYARFDDFMAAIDWALQRKPRFYSQMGGDYYVLDSGKLADSDFPSVKVVYRILQNENKVILLDIE